MGDVMTRQQAVAAVLDLYGRIDELNGALEDMAGRLADAGRRTDDGRPDDGGLSGRAAKVLPVLLWEKVAGYGLSVRIVSGDEGPVKTETFDAWLGHVLVRDYLPDGLSFSDVASVCRDYATPIYERNRAKAVADAIAERDEKDGGEDE